MYISTKTYKHLGPVAYRQWRADSHCNLIHGYALSFHFEFESEELDARNWVMDFGGTGYNSAASRKLIPRFNDSLIISCDCCSSFC